MNILNNGIRMSFQNFRYMKANTKKEKSIFRTILAAMLLVLGIEILLLVAALGISHVNCPAWQNGSTTLHRNWLIQGRSVLEISKKIKKIIFC